MKRSGRKDQGKEQSSDPSQRHVGDRRTYVSDSGDSFDGSTATSV